MSPLIPEDSLAFITQCVLQGRIFWTYHVNMRMKDRSISRQMIVQSTANYQVIESYPEDKYLPSYLVFSHDHGILFHVLFATDVANRNVRVVTAYTPDQDQWNPDCKTRRVM